MGHGGRAYFAFHGFLLEVAQGNITPDIPVQINQNGVESSNGVVELGDVIVGFNLGGVRVPVQAQAFNEFLGVLGPVD